MHLDESTEGPYRIYAGALEARQGGGYIAAVVVKRIGHGLQRAAKPTETRASPAAIAGSRLERRCATR